MSKKATGNLEGQVEAATVETEPAFAKSMIEGLLRNATNQRIIAESRSMQLQSTFEKAREQKDDQIQLVFLLRGVEQSYAALLGTLEPQQG